MRAPAIGLLVVLVPLSGCLGFGGGGGEPMQLCLERAVTVEWVEPGASEGLRAGAARLGWPVETTAPRSGFPSPLEGATALAVSWQPNHPLPAPVLRLMDSDSGGGLLVELSDAGDAARDERLLRAFLAEVGLADEPEAEAWIATFLHGAPGAGVEAQGRREVQVRAAPDLSSVLARLGQAPVEPRGVGGARMESGAWSVDLQVPFHTVRAPVQGHTLTLTFDDQDQVRGRLAWDAIDGSWFRFQARIAETFAQMGLPEPTWVGATGGGSC